MPILFLIICVIFTTAFLKPARAETSPPYLSSAIDLWQRVAPPDKTHLFDSIHFNPVTGDDAPLARYRPENGGSLIEIGQNFRQYRRDYAVLSSNQDMAFKPEFDQYMSVLTLLSLANESTHYMQDKNGSLKDFYTFYQNHKTQEACALYGLQQYASDVVMMESAVRMEKYFLGQGSVKGLNALRIALEKNALRDEFEDFREGLKTHDIMKINTILHVMRAKRNDANMAGLDFCDNNGDALLDQSIIDRAIEPAKSALSVYYITTPQQAKKTPKFNR